MNIPWDLIISAILDMLENCQKQGVDRRIMKQRMTSPSVWEWLRLRAGLRARGLRGQQLDMAMTAARQHVYTPVLGDDWAEELLSQVGE